MFDEEKVVAELEALRLENARLVAINELTFDYSYAFCVLPNGTLHLDRVSGAFTDITDYTSEEITQVKQLLDIVHPEDRAAIEARFGRLFANQDDICEFRIVTKNGAVRWLRDHARPIWDEARGCVVQIIGAAQDITQQRLAEEALRESEELLSRVIDLNPYSIFVKDSQGRYLLINKAGTLLYDATPTEVLHKTDMEIAGQFGLNFAEAARVMAGDRQVIERKQTVFLPAEPFTRRDGSVRWFQVIKVPLALRQDPNCLVGITVDVTDQRNFEAELNRRNQELALLYQVSQTVSASLELDVVLETVLTEICRILELPAGSIWLLDDESGELVCRQSTGPQCDIVRGWRLPLGEGLGGWAVRTGESLIVADALSDERHFVDVDRQTGMALRSIASIPLRIRARVLGVIQLVDTRADRFSQANLELLESLAANAAIAVENARLYAEEQQRVEALAQTLAQQRELDRLKDQFIQNVSHELRTPLTIARGYADLLADEELGALQPSQREAAQTVARRLAMLTQLVEDINALLDVATRKPKLGPVDWALVVRQGASDFYSTVERAGLRLVVETPDFLPPVLASEIYLQRVLDNLLSNACKFTPAGGVITVRLFQEGEMAVLQVADTGIGIPEYEFEKIFERFYQVDGSSSRRYGGTGLGLALVKEIVTTYAGSIDVSSAPGEGSAFTVRLPLLALPPEALDVDE